MIDSPALERLRSLDRRGQLVADYPQVRRLVTELRQDELPTAGGLLAWLDVDELSTRHPMLPVARVAVAGDVPAHAVLPPLAVELAKDGLLLRSTLTRPEAWVYDLADPHSGVYAARPNLTLCLVRPESIDERLVRPSGPAGFEQAVQEFRRLVSSLLEVHERETDGVLLFSTLAPPAPAAPHRGIGNAQPLLGALWREANAWLLRLAAEHPGLEVVDAELGGAGEGTRTGEDAGGATGAAASAEFFDERFLLVCARTATRLVRRGLRPRGGGDDPVPA